MTAPILAVSCYYHDSAAAIVSNGAIIAAAQEERFTRKKHDASLPVHSIDYCLKEAGVEPGDLEAVVYYENPMATLERILKAQVHEGGDAFAGFHDAALPFFSKRIHIEAHLRDVLGRLGKNDTLFLTEHHMAHAASAFFPSPFRDAAILTIDGVGEWATTTLAYGKDTELTMLREIHFPHSIGLLYSAFTYYCGFRVNSGEYKLMGLAPYGKPRFYETIRDNLIDIKPDGSFRLNLDYVGWHNSTRIISPKFDQLFGAPPREPESPFQSHYLDMAASIQQVTEEVVSLLAAHAKRLTGSKNLALAGGVALNCVSNGKLLKAGLFDNVWVQPAAGDAGGALGAALLADHVHCKTPRQVGNGRDAMKNCYLGPSFSRQKVEASLQSHRLDYEVYADRDELFSLVARELADGKVIGFFYGKMEFGPRALGARSIVADARNDRMQSILNLKVKKRESFRPFAPVVLLEDAPGYFDLAGASPYMLFVADVLNARKDLDVAELIQQNDSNLYAIANLSRSGIPAVTHVNNTARIQTADEQSPFFHKLLRAFKEATRHGILVNTSFNVRGEPIVCTPSDAILCFLNTGIDILVIEDCIAYKDMQITSIM